MTQYTAFLLLAPLSAVSSVGVLFYVLRRGLTPKTKGLIWLMVSIIGWLVFNSLELISRTPSWTIFWAKVSYPFIAATPVAWLIFTLRYTDNEAVLQLPGVRLGLLVPSLSVLFLWSNQLHGWMWRSYEFVDAGRWLALQVVHGFWFYVHAAYSYALTFL
ncbi:MAG: histidine kinase N-terminal 7TM domain-containing protein, partial [Anaerolineae bacterium]